jgi:hypothetical protein
VKDELLVFFDVTALYPNVDFPPAMKHLNVWLKSIGLERSKFTMYMNAQCPSIKFTREIEKEGVLPFLEVEVFRKPTNTQRFIVN